MAVAFPGARWQEGDYRFIPRSSFGSGGVLFNSTTATPIPDDIGPFNSWHTIDLAGGSEWNGADMDFPTGHAAAIKAVLLEGICIGSANGNTDNEDLFIAWRAYGDSHGPGSYQWQLKSHDLQGTRAAYSLVVPVREGKIEMYWRRSISFSCGFTVRINGYWV